MKELKELMKRDARFRQLVGMYNAEKMRADVAENRIRELEKKLKDLGIIYT